MLCLNSSTASVFIVRVRPGIKYFPKGSIFSFKGLEEFLYFHDSPKQVINSKSSVLSTWFASVLGFSLAT